MSATLQKRRLEDHSHRLNTKVLDIYHRLKAKSNRSMRRTQSKKSHSWWWDSHVGPKNSRWLAENLEEMDQSVKRMLKLIEEDGDSFAKRAEIYYQKRPELIAHVEEFYRMYRALAERYDHLTGEVRKNIPSDVQSQGSGISDVGSDPSSTLRLSDERLTRRNSGGSSSDLCEKDDEEFPTLDSQSESDDSSIHNYETKVVELELELSDVKEKLRTQLEENQEIRALRETIFNANKSLSEENSRLQGEMNKLLKEQAYLEDSIKEWDLHCQSVEAGKAEMKDQMDEMRKHLHELHIEHVKLITGNETARKFTEELRSRVTELEKEVDRKEEIIMEGAEEKREAIRQLCFSIEHYRNGYHWLREALLELKQLSGMAGLASE